MIKSREDYKGNIFYEVIGDFEERKNKYGVYHYTVNGLIQLLMEVQEAGHGDKMVAIGYDSDICYTAPYPEFEIKGDNIYFKGTA